jgi:hypothetical protein
MPEVSRFYEHFNKGEIKMKFDSPGQAERQPQVGQEMDYLGNIINKLETSTQNLLSRLDSVLRDEQLQNEDNCEKAVPATPLVKHATAIRAYKWTLESVQRTVDSILSRLEL